MKWVPGERELRDGSNELKVRFESPEVGGVKLAKTYTFKRGSYARRRQARGDQRLGRADRAAALPATRARRQRAGRANRASISPSPARRSTTDADKFKKIDFKAIEKRGANEKPDHPVAADNGWVAMVQHYFASAWLLPEKACSASSSPRKVDTNLYAVGMIVPLANHRAGASKTLGRTLFVGPQEENKLERAGARASNW